MRTFSIYRSSAGSGKTRTLARQYLAFALRHRVDYFKHILAVTFTNKASQEMKDRILRYLDEFANGKQDSLAQELMTELQLDPLTFQTHCKEVQSRLLQQYDQFSISTIDAFFQRVIRAFTREAGFAGDYRLEVDQDSVLEEVIDELIDELGRNAELTRWVVDFARLNLENERPWDVRQSLIEFAKEIFRDEFKLIEDEFAANTRATLEFRGLFSKLIHLKADYIEFIRRRGSKGLAIIQEAGYSQDDFKYKGGPYHFFRKAAQISSVSDFEDRINGANPQTKFQDPANWPATNSPSSKAIKTLAESQLIGLMNEILAFGAKDIKTMLTIDVILENMYSLGLIADITRKLRDYKSENNVMLLADAPKFLNGVIGESDTPFIYEKVGSFFKHYLIDEFQDTSGMQWKNFQPLIINSLDQGDQSLIVGDVKQAIYRWRGGDLNLLQEKITSSIGVERVEDLALTSNYRSARRLVELNNQLFIAASKCISLETGSALPTDAYNDLSQQITKEENGFAEIRFLENDEGDHSDKKSWRHKALDQLVQSLETLQEQGAQLKDIAILVRRNDEGQSVAAHLLAYKDSSAAKAHCSYDVVSNESLRIDGAGSVNLLLGAMRYLLNTDDAIARAQLAFEYFRLHHPEGELTDVFSVGNQINFENNLPKEFSKEKVNLKKLPLVELTETLIGIFGVGEVAGEMAYLQAFQDVILEFQTRERNDLEAFLEWWETNKHKKSVQIAGDVNAVQILTIHKAKGLQFKYVIIPFCSWSLDHEPWQSPNLWVRSEEGLLKDIGYVPVRYSSKLSMTYFADFYAAERTKIFLDNLNLLYVAFTRAESGMFVSAPVDAKGCRSIAAVLLRCLSEDSNLKQKWIELQLLWRSGDIQIEGNSKEANESPLVLRKYSTFPWREKLFIRRSPIARSSEQGRLSVVRGLQMHAALSRIRYAHDLDAALTGLMLEGIIAKEDANGLSQELSQMLRDKRIANWFSTEWEVRTEVPLLLPGGDTCRIDRLLTKDRSAIIIDFKTGDRNKADLSQVETYVSVLRKMNFPVVKGFLLYLKDLEIVEASDGRRIKVSKAKKDTTQLELGL